MQIGILINGVHTRFFYIYHWEEGDVQTTLTQVSALQQNQTNWFNTGNMDQPLRSSDHMQGAEENGSTDVRDAEESGGESIISDH